MEWLRTKVAELEDAITHRSTMRKLGSDQAAVREEAAGGPAPSHLRIEQSKEANANQESQSELSKLQAQVGYC